MRENSAVVKGLSQYYANNILLYEQLCIQWHDIHASGAWLNRANVPIFPLQLSPFHVVTLQNSEQWPSVFAMSCEISCWFWCCHFPLSCQHLHPNMVLRLSRCKLVEWCLQGIKEELCCSLQC